MLKLLKLLTTILIFHQSAVQSLDTKLLENCYVWYDGCNYCKVLNGVTLKCNQMVCDKKGEPKCIKTKTVISTSEVCETSLTQKEDGETLVKEESWSGAFDLFFANSKPDLCLMNYCSLTGCQETDVLHTSNFVSINSKNTVKVTYDKKKPVAEAFCIACSNSKKIMKSKITISS